MLNETRLDDNVDIADYYMIDAVSFVVHRPLFSIFACNFHSLSKSTGRDLIFSKEEWG